MVLIWCWQRHAISSASRAHRCRASSSRMSRSVTSSRVDVAIDVGVMVGTDDDIVLAGGGGTMNSVEERNRHGAGTGVDRHGGQAHAVEHRDVGGVVLVGVSRPAEVEICRKGVLHRGRASEQAALGGRELVANLVCIWYQIEGAPCGGDLGEVGEYLLLGHAGGLAPCGRWPEHLVAHDLHQPDLPESGVHRGAGTLDRRWHPSPHG